MTQDGYGRNTTLSDPFSCGEDLPANLEILAGLAETHCVDCGGYHAWHGLDRVIRTRTGIDNDRPDLVALLQRTFASMAARPGADRVRVIIAGAADTGIISTCAHAASLLGEETAAKLHYTILDRCQSPLSLCKVYAARYGLALDTIKADFMDPLPSLEADVIILHSVLSYFSPARHADFLRELGHMLTPSGRMILSNRILVTRDPKDYGLLLQQAIAAGRLKPSATVDRIMQLAVGEGSVVHEFRDEQELLDLIAAAGLTIEATAKVAKLRERPADAKPQHTTRFIATLHL